MRALLFAVALAGCSFQHGALGTSGSGSDDAAIGDGAAGDATADAVPRLMCNPADLDLRSCFTFDGSVTEGSGYSHSTSTTNVSFAPGYDGQAVEIMNGTNISVTGSASSFDVSTFTFRMWIKPNTLPASGTRMGLIDSGNRYRMFLLPGGALRCAITSGPDLVTGVGLVTVGVWQRVACTFDGSYTRIFVNGVQKAMLMQNGSVPTSSSGIVIGQNNPSGENLDGAIDDFELWGSVVAP